MASRKKREVEVKLRVTDRAAVRRALRRLRARNVGRVHEMNTLYDTPRGRFRKRGHLLRLRLVTPDGREEQYGLLTYKGPSLTRRGGEDWGGVVGPAASRQRYKVREELEVRIPDAQRLGAILEAVGLIAAFRYEKFRTSYVLARVPGVDVELDETPIGTFLELEGPPGKIDRAAKLLGYTPRDYITRSYLALHLEKCRRKARHLRRLRDGGRIPDMVFPVRWRGRKRRKS